MYGAAGVYCLARRRSSTVRVQAAALEADRQEGLQGKCGHCVRAKRVNGSWSTLCRADFAWSTAASARSCAFGRPLPGPLRYRKLPETRSTAACPQRSTPGWRSWNDRGAWWQTRRDAGREHRPAVQAALRWVRTVLCKARRGAGVRRHGSAKRPGRGRTCFSPLPPWTPPPLLYLPPHEQRQSLPNPSASPTLCFACRCR
eukprot:366510-Chlamydomonas_euryale.AAC.17